MISFLIGPARSGKSTYCKEWLLNMPKRVVVNADQIRLELTGHRYFVPAEPVVHSIKLMMVRVLHSQGYHVLVDGTHTTEQSVMDLLYIDPEANPIWIPSREMYITDPYNIEAVCHQRARATGQEDLFPVITRMVKQAATLAENFPEKLEAMRVKSVKYNPNRSAVK